MAKTFAMVLGVVLLGVGLWGTVTGGGHDHKVMVFGINPTHNLVHAVSGALALILALSGERGAKLFCLLFGAVYGIVALAGLFNIGAVVQMLNLNMADNLLHLAIAAACLFVGAQSKPAAAPAAV